MKLKLIAAAVLAASGVAHADINNGGAGNGDFFFNIWDTNGSYTTDLGFSQDQFTSALAGSGAYSFSLDLMSDTNFAAFISSANLAELQWNVLAVDGSGQRRIHQTYTELPEQALTANNGRSAVGTVQTFIGNVNDTLRSTGGDSASFGNTLAAYAGNLGCSTFSYSNCGTVGSSLGLVLETYAGTGTTRGAFTPLFDGAQPLAVSLDAAYNLQIAAVPEPETYAMLLAGLGLMGAVARRRRQNKA